MEYLRLFDAVAQAGSITGAAERLFASQPAISRQLARLERNLGVRLFDRMPRGVKLTRAGDLLRGYARRIFSTEVEAAEAIAEFRGLRRGRLHLGASLTIGSYLLPGILAQYCRGYPEIDPFSPPFPRMPVSCDASATQHFMQAKVVDGDGGKQ